MGSIKIAKELVKNDKDSTDRKEIFVDREPQRKIFRKNIGAIGEGSQLLYYAGAGGVGKTALIRELEKYVNSDSSKSLNFKSVSYDFTFGTEMLTVLNALKKFLTDNCEGIEFTLFERGCFSYYNKCGNESGKDQIKKIWNEGKYFNKNQIRQKLGMLTQQSYNARNVDRFIDESIDAVEYMAESIPMFRLVKTAINFLDERIADIKNIRFENDESYRKFMDELEKREKHYSAEAIKEYLPTLFAMDISYWLKQNKKYMVIFLDTYEQLTEDEKGVKRHEKLIYGNKDVPVDWWIEDLLLNTERVAWVIAGRGEVEKIGKDITLKAKKDIFQLKSLENNFVDEFLKLAEIEDSKLREGIIKLTRGYPVYLAACVDTYRAIIAKSEIPTIEDFGKKRETVINRLLAYMDEGARNIVKRLCILGKWTDDFAMRTFSILHENNRDTYNRVKNLSFVSEQNEKIFAFDRSIQKILFDHLLKNEPELIFQTRDAVCQFLKSAFYNVDAEENQNITNEDRVLFFKFWAEIILRTTQNAEYLMKQYADNLEPVSVYLDDTVTEEVTFQFKDRIEKKFGKENIPYAYFEHLFAQVKFSDGNDIYIKKLSQVAYEKIASESNVARLKNYFTAGYYSIALFYAMDTDKDTDEYKNFSENFKLAIKNMPTSEKKLVIAYYGRILKTLLNVYRKSNKVIATVDQTIDFKECFGESANEFVANLLLYKLSAMNHLGKIVEFHQISTECSQAVKAAGNFELNVIYINLMVVNLQDVFDYAESLKLGNRGIDLIESTNFSVYKDQYFRLCGSLVQTCYLTLNNSTENLKFAMEYSDAAINGFTRTFDKMRQYQLRAQIEAEVGEFETAFKMLDKGLNISLENPQSEHFKNFLDYSWNWYHFAKFSERLLKSNDETYFEIAKRAIETAKDEFLNYQNKIGKVPEHPVYITFSKMGTCFDILGDTSLAIDLHLAAVRGVDSEIAGNISVNANAAAFRLVMLASYLLTLEKNNNRQKADDVIQKLKNYLDEYFTQVNIGSMKVPFDGWQDLIDSVEKNSADKLELLEKMSRAILL